MAGELSWVKRKKRLLMTNLAVGLSGADSWTAVMELS